MLLAQKKPPKEDVIRSLLEFVKQAVEKKAEPNGSRPIKKPRDMPPFIFHSLESGQRPTLEIKGECKTMVDWISGHANLKKRECTLEKTRNFLRDRWGWAFRREGAKGRVEEWVDTAHVLWSEVIGLCGFWDGSCDNGKCGAGIMIM